MTGSTNRRRLAIMLATVGLLSFATVALADHGFTDVPHGFTHEAGIDYVADAGITQGCTADEYCPNDPLTRGQMGTFLYRASGNDPDTAPSVNAAELDGHGPSAYTTTVFSEDLTTPGETLVSAIGDDQARTIVSLSDLPPGEYVATGAAAVAAALPSVTPTEVSIVCALWMGDNELRRADTRIGTSDGAVNSATIPLSAHVTIQDAATLTLRCHQTAASSTIVGVVGNEAGTLTHLIATRVGDAN